MQFKGRRVSLVPVACEGAVVADRARAGGKNWWPVCGPDEGGTVAHASLLSFLPRLWYDTSTFKMGLSSAKPLESGPVASHF